MNEAKITMMLDELTDLVTMLRNNAGYLRGVRAGGGARVQVNRVAINLEARATLIAGILGYCDPDRLLTQQPAKAGAA